MIITFDFDSETFTTEQDGITNTMHEPGLASRQDAIMKAAGIRELKMEELADDIDKLLDGLGLHNVRAGRPKKQEDDT